jgi:cytochrome c peroxidase
LGKRNAPSLINIAYQPYFMREGGVPTLEMQVLVPIQEHAEMDMNILEVSRRLNEVPEYVTMSQKAYGRDPDPFVITRAIASYERTLIGGTSLYDRFISTGDSAVLSASARRGMTLFFDSRTSCSSCHGGTFFTDHRFANNGLYQVYADPGRERLTNDPADNALFKVPSLRNVERTPPYMHNGSVATLEDVLNHYNSGGKDHPHRHPLIRPLGLTSDELRDLRSFLATLSDVTR